MKTLHQGAKRKLEHVLVRIKNALELSQAEIPEWFGISLDTFKNIAYRNPKSWDKYAAVVSRNIGVSVKSLLANDPRKPLIGNDEKTWTAEKYKAGIAARNVNDLVRERSRGRHTLQWFRILMIKVARVMLAAYKDRKSGEAFVMLLKAIGEVGKSFPSYTQMTPYKPKPGEPVLSECPPPNFIAVPVKEICRSEQWDHQLQSAVAAIDSRSKQGMEIIFDRFVAEILSEETSQNRARANDLAIAEEKAIAIQKANEQKNNRTARE